ncbi:flagellar operon protein [Clostridium amylolyticum]|uniref:Flagellar operon protein n=1 Tax=Clostridium amylolyticum TaxID=1121298 RepID=A0A1M6CGC7_9CLOT|nr:TIGR02530 family flagellar biosynthesis protein [Clostridium amylolyticum]SHI59738.1 flagellar operon protein [Clostridium amylolyticum]
MSYRIINGKPYAIENLSALNSNHSQNLNKSNKNIQGNFKNYLDNEINKNDSFTVSAHAGERIKSLNLNSRDFEKINEGFNMAEKKGSKNTVILYKDIAFIASVENRTLITAIEKQRSKDNIFTNIDSLVIL